jgi:mono/diheme cytochrome c family protein
MYFPRSILIAIGTIVLCACNNNPTGNESGESVPTGAPVKYDAMANGKRIFEDRCSPCHGNDGAAGVAGAANLQSISADSATVLKTIADGKKAMPGFADKLSASEIEDVGRYVRNLHK